MRDLMIFSKPEFGNISIIELEDEPWFLAKEITEILGYSNQTDAIKDNVEKEDCKVLNFKAFRYEVEALWRGNDFSNKTLINESGLYSLILSSRLPSAKQFKKWVTSEVLPSIRKHGMYATETTIDRILNDPDFGIELLTKLKEERAARVEAERKNAILMHVTKTYTATEIAKELGLKSAIALNKLLEEKRVQFKVNGTWVLYSDFSNCGYEEVKQEVLDNGKVVYHRRFTQMGRDFILNLLGSLK